MHKQKDGKTTYKGTKIDGITSQFGLEQLIHEPNHISGERSSCIDLIFASRRNLVVESGVKSSLHQNCHHQINSILKKQMLTILEELLMVSNGKNHFKI